MDGSPTNTNILHGIDMTVLEGLSARQRRTIAVIMARAAERAYRRGVQHGITITADPDRTVRDVAEWRYGPGVDASPWFDSNTTETALERLHVENQGLAAAGFPSEVSGGGVGVVDVPQTAERLRNSVAAYHAEEVRAAGKPTTGMMLAKSEIRAIGIEIHTLGGGAAMSDVYDELVERHGARAARGVEAAWTLIGAWSA